MRVKGFAAPARSARASQFCCCPDSLFVPMSTSPPRQMELANQAGVVAAEAAIVEVENRERSRSPRREAPRPLPAADARLVMFRAGYLSAGVNGLAAAAHRFNQDVVHLRRDVVLGFGGRADRRTNTSELWLETEEIVGRLEGLQTALRTMTDSLTAVVNGVVDVQP